MANMVRVGYGQVEPNHLSAQRTAQIWAQLPAAEDIDILENGQFVKYDVANGEVNTTGEGQWMMVWNEVKLYKDGRDREGYKDWAMIKKNYIPGPKAATATTPGTYDANMYHSSEAELGEMLDHVYEDMPFPGQMYPRVIIINVGDIWTTNTFVSNNTSNTASLEMEEYAVGDILGINASGFLSKDGDTDQMKFQVVKVYTMPDLQAGVKVMRIA